MAVLFVVIVYLNAKQDGGEDRVRPVVAWEETTTAFDPSCREGCEVISYVRPGHHGLRIPLMYNPAVDDPVAQWSVCVDQVMHCYLDGKGVAACVEAASCPLQCREQFAADVSSVADEEKQLDLFEQLFLNEGAYCLPPERHVDGTSK